MKFLTQYDKVLIPNKTQPGCDEYPTYTSDDKGNPVVSGKSNIKKEIQSHKESVELSTLLQRYAAGDITALNKVEGAYVDVAGMPSSFSELYDQVKQAEDDFNKLPESLRKLFNNSTVEFWTQFGTDDFNEKISKYRDSKRSVKEGNNQSNTGSNNNTQGGASIDE